MIVDNTAKHTCTILRINNFCGFSMGGNQYSAGRVYGSCVYFMMGTPEGRIID